MPVQPSSRRACVLVKGEPNEESLSVPTSHGDVSAPAPANHDHRVDVTEAPQIHNMDRSSKFKSETHGETTDGGTLRQNGESNFSWTMDSDIVNGHDMSVRRPLRPW